MTRVSDRFQIIFGIVFWAVLIGIVFAAQDGCNQRPSSNGRRTITVNRPKVHQAATFRKHEQAGTHYYSKGDYSEAVANQRRAVKASPDDSRAQYNLACYLCLNGEIDEALEALETSVNLDVHYASYALTDDDFERIEDDPAFLTITIGGTGNSALKKKNYSTAYRSFVKLTDQVPLRLIHPDQLFQMSCAAASAKKLDDAISWLEEAIERDLSIARRAVEDTRLEKLKNNTRFFETVSPAFRESKVEESCEESRCDEKDGSISY